MSDVGDRLSAIGEVQRRIAEVLAPLRDAFAPVLDAIAPVTAVLEGSPFRDFVEEWPQLHERYRSLTHALREACLQASLPPFRLLDIDESHEIERVLQDDGVAAAAALVERLSREALANAEIRQQLLRDWRANPIVATRATILEEALRAHELGLFAVSIPPFLAQLEGVVADSKHAPEKGNPSFGKLKEYVEELAAGDELMGRLASEYVCDTIYQRFDRAKDAPPFSRHAILHGFDTRYANEANSVRAILVFDCIQDLALDHLKTSGTGA